MLWGSVGSSHAYGTHEWGRTVDSKLSAVTQLCIRTKINTTYNYLHRTYKIHAYWLYEPFQHLENHNLLQFNLEFTNLSKRTNRLMISMKLNPS